MEVNDEALDDFSEYSDSNDEAPVATIVYETEPFQPLPEYTAVELDELLTILKKMVLLDGLSESDWNDECDEVIKTWFTDTNHVMLTIFIATEQQRKRVKASLIYPTEPVSEVVYFLREPNHIFSLDTFHDDITFGRIDEDVDGTLLTLMEKIYAPMFFAKDDWSDLVRAQFCASLHSFLANMTALHYKLSGLTVLYVPSEGLNKCADAAIEDNEFVQRLELVAEHWVAQLRLGLSDSEQVAPFALICPIDEYDFWVYRHEVLLAMQHQISQKDFLHILNILKKSQSTFVKPIEELMIQTTNEIKRAHNNILYLKLLLKPCEEISNAESPATVPMKVAKIINTIRYIWLNSAYYNRDELITKIFRYVGNQIIRFCQQKIDVAATFKGKPVLGIKLANMSIDCCLYYKVIYNKIATQHRNCDSSIGWNLNDGMIFNHIDTFIQRLYDFIEVCEGIIIFGRRYASENVVQLQFGGDRGSEFEETCQHIERLFDIGLVKVVTVAKLILNIYEKSWSKLMQDFKMMTQQLEQIVENLIVNVFTRTENLEEGIYALACLHRFSGREKLRKSYDRQVAIVWKMFADELSQTNDQLVDEHDKHLSHVPKLAGRAAALKTNRDRITRLRNLIEKAEWLSDCFDTERILSQYNQMVASMNQTIQRLFNEWIQSLGIEVVSKINRTLLVRSLTHAGLFECNIDRSIFDTFKEARFFKMLGFGFPVHVNQFFTKETSIKLTYDAVVDMITPYNKMLMSMSVIERALLRPLIQLCDRCIEHGAYKLMWSSDGIDVYMADCNRNIRELGDFMDVFRKANANIVRSCEQICDVIVVKISNKEPRLLHELEESVRTYLNERTSEVRRHHENILNMILLVYNGLETHMESIQENWKDYVLKFEKLIEEAITTSVRESLKSIFDTLHGDGIMGPKPLLHMQIDIEQKTLILKPKLEQLADFFGNIFDEIRLALTTIPRLMHRLNLITSITLLDYHKLVECDPECLHWNSNIEREIICNEHKVQNYMDQWMQFAHICQSDKGDFFRKLGADKQTTAATFDKNIQTLIVSSNKVAVREILSPVHFMIVNATNLRQLILTEIDDWKCQYLTLLKDKTLQKLTDFFRHTEENGEKVLKVPKTVDQLQNCCSLYEQLMSDVECWKCCLNDLGEQFDVLHKYNVVVDDEFGVMKTNMWSQWDNYVSKLNDADEMLCNAKESFKLTLQSSRKTPDFF